MINYLNYEGDTVMIIYFSAKNFRSIREEITLDFRATGKRDLEEYYCYKSTKSKLRLLRLMMLYGPNASGKSNILRALDFMRNCVVTNRVDKTELIEFDPFILDRNKETQFDIGFLQGDTIFEYHLTMMQTHIIKEELSYYPVRNKAKLYIRETTMGVGSELVTTISWGAKAGLKKQTKEAFETLVGNQTVLNKVKSIQLSGPIQDAFDWFNSYLAPMISMNTRLTEYTAQSIFRSGCSTECKDFVLSQLREADFGIQDIKQETEEVKLEELPPQLAEIIQQAAKENDKPIPQSLSLNSLQIEHNFGKDTAELDFDDESDGTKRYLGLLGPMYNMSAKSRCFFIDEIENSLHHELVKHLMISFLQSNEQSQLLFTTHNIALLGEKDILRQDAIWVTEKKPDGSTNLYSISEFPLRKEHSIMKLYRTGKLGGIPKIG